MTLPIFLSNDEVILHRLTTFHRERVEMIRLDKTRPALKDPSRLIVHLIPQQAVLSRKEFAATELKNAAAQQIYSLGPRNQTYSYSRFNADGMLFSSSEEVVRSYCQLFRNGVYEGAMSDLTFQQQPHPKTFREEWCEEAMMSAVSNYLRFAKRLGMECPIWMFAAVVGCEGARICFDRQWGDHAQGGIDRSSVWLPELKIEDFESEPAKALRPVFDVMFNAAGLECSFHYDEHGNRKVAQ